MPKAPLFYMENTKRKLTDPEEFAIIRDIYFEKDYKDDDIDQQERWDRLESRIKNNNKSSR